MANEKRLIDANALMKRFYNYYDCVNEFTSKNGYRGDTLMDYEVADMIYDCIDNAPTVDAVEVVRCKDCVHRREPTECPMCYETWVEYDDGDGYCDTDILIHDRSIDEGFCDRGEREDNG